MMKIKRTISERIFKLLAKKNMKQKDFASQAGIANSTVSEWKKKKTNPSSDKIMDICAVLGVTPEQLLTGKGIEDVDETQILPESRITSLDMQIIEDYHGLQDTQKKRLLTYVETLKRLEALEKLEQ